MLLYPGNAIFAPRPAAVPLACLLSWMCYPVLSFVRIGGHPPMPPSLFRMILQQQQQGKRGEMLFRAKRRQRGKQRYRQQGRRQHHRVQQQSPSRLHMALVPLPVDELEDLVAINRTPSYDQFTAYWGRSEKERYGRMVEVVAMSTLGMFVSHALGFVLGDFLATVTGCFFLFYGVLAPQYKAYQRNREFRGGRDFVDDYYCDGDDCGGGDDDENSNNAGLYGAFFVGRISKLCVVEDVHASTRGEEIDLSEFVDYTTDTDELEQHTGKPYLLRIQASDSHDDDDNNNSDGARVLQFHARMSEEYLDLRLNQPSVAIVLSTSPRFTSLEGLTDIYVPDARCWIGDYPYLDRARVERLLDEDDGVWELVQSQRYDKPNLKYTQ